LEHSVRERWFSAALFVLLATLALARMENHRGIQDPVSVGIAGEGSALCCEPNRQNLRCQTVEARGGRAICGRPGIDH
jgi:hypothetical protein